MILDCCYANVLLGSCLMFISFKLRRATLHGFFCSQRGAGISTQQQIETPVPFTFLFYAFFFPISSNVRTDSTFGQGEALVFINSSVPKEQILEI